MARRNYVMRTSGGMRRKVPVSKRRPRSKIPLPLILILAIILIVTLVLIFVKPSKGSEGSSVSEVTSSAPVEGETTSAASEPTSDATSIPEEPVNAGVTSIQLKLDDLTPAQERDISSASKEYFNTMFIVGDSGYRYFTFSENQTIKFIDAIKAFSSAVSTSVHTMVVPTAADIMLSQSFLADVNTSDQEKALDYINASISQVAPEVKTLDLYGILKANCDKDIYFKTDRNWTQLGAYLAYYEFIKSKGVEPKPLTDFVESTAEGFRGSLYSQSQQNSALESPENIVSYKPTYSTTMMVLDDSDSSEKPLIGDADAYESADKYNIFLAGNHAYTSIVNPEITDGSSIIVLKDSMGSALVPFLTAHYQTIIAVDYRYYSGSLRSLVSDKSPADVLLMPQIELTSDVDILSEFTSLLS